MRDVRRGWRWRPVGTAVAILLAAACATGGGHRGGKRFTATNPPVPPPRARAVSSPRGAVAACSIEAARVGAAVLASGGNAVDAAVATVLALGATDPASLGLGADIVMTIHMADGRDVTVDAPSFAPIRVDPEKLAEIRKTKRRWGDRWGRIGTTVPTGLAVLGTALERYGTRPFAELVEPAVGLAAAGFRLGRYQRAVLGIHRVGLVESPVLSKIFLGPGGEVPPAGAVVGRDPMLARTLRTLARNGWRDFYTGEVARAIEADMEANGGWVTRVDLGRALLAVQMRPPLRFPYRDRTVLAPPDPRGGEVLRIGAGIVDRFPPAVLERDTVDRIHLIAEAFRLADAARNVENAVGRRAASPWAGTEKTPVAERLAGLIRFGRIVPLERVAEAMVPGLGSHTTHVSVMDADGNAVSVTGTLGRFFGTKAASPELGFIYNILMSGFQFDDPRKPGYPRPLAPVRGDMCPVIVLRNGRAEAALGTGGSARIPSIEFNVVSNLVDRGMDLAEAVSFPRVAWNGGSEQMVYLEVRPPVGEGVVEALKRRGFEHVLAITYPATATDRGLLGEVDAVMFDPATGLFTGVGDPRRDGRAAAVPPAADQPRRLR